MLQLRSLSVTASFCGIAYNLLQPTPLWAPAAWGAFFISCHLHLGPVDLIILQVGHVFFQPGQHLAIRMTSQSNRDTVSRTVDWSALMLSMYHENNENGLPSSNCKVLYHPVASRPCGYYTGSWSRGTGVSAFAWLPFVFSGSLSIQYHWILKSFTELHHVHVSLNVSLECYSEVVWTGCLWDGFHASWLYTSTISESRWCCLRTNWRSRLRYLFMSSRRDASRDVSRDSASDIFEKYIWDFPALRQVNRRNGFTISWKVKPCWLTRRTDPKCRCQW